MSLFYYLTNELLKLSFCRLSLVAKTQQSGTLGKIVYLYQGLVKIVLFARVSSSKYGVGDILERECLELRWSGTIKSKTEVSWTYVRWKKRGWIMLLQVLYNITKLLLGRNILKKKNKKEKCDFLKYLDFLTFWLSYSKHSIIISSGTQQINFMEKFGVKACRFILY